MKNKRWLYLFVFLSACFVIQYLGSFFTFTSVLDWYPTIKKASWNPPPWVFGPVWTLLYLMIAISGWLIFIGEKSENRTKALSVYSLQLLFNLLWSFLFFYLKSPFLGLIDIILLWPIIGLTIYFSYTVSRVGSLLLVPYFLWTGYAVTLNFATWILNK